MRQILYLADYFAVIDSKEDDVPKVKFRVPEKDVNKENPFPEGIEHFALPNGWQVLDEWHPPKFHSVQLTKVDGSPFWASFFNYYYRDNGKFYPSSLVLITRHNHSKQLQNALMLIYEAHITGENNLERLLAKILSQPVPHSSKLMIRYRLTQKDFQAIQPPLSPHIPTSGKSVANLLNWIGPTNLFNLVLLLLTDNKVALFGRSYHALSESNTALHALIYPLKYSFPNIPVLPRKMCDMLMSPVPFLVGVHADIWDERYGENPDVIGCDLDGSKLIIPEHIFIPNIPDLIRKEVIHRLTLVSQPALVCADLAFPPSKQTSSPPIILDKEIRAIFLLFLVKTLRGYRLALQFTRIHPVIQSRLVEDRFISPTDEKTFRAQIINSQSFSIFLQDRGPAYRPTDLFDKLIEEESKKRITNEYEIGNYELSNEVKLLRDELIRNELPNWAKERDIDQVLPVESLDLDKDLSTKTAEAFKILSDTSVTAFFLEEEKNHGTKLDRMLPDEEICYRIETDEEIIPKMASDTNTRRHLSVMTEYIKFLFEEDSSELKKHFLSVIRALKSKIVRSHFCHEILHRWPKNEPMTSIQFDYCSRLIDAVLTNSTGTSDETYVARNIIQISSKIYRKLSKEKQFLYTLIQDHPIWSNTQFWMEYFFHKHQKSLVRHYQKQKKQSLNEDNDFDDNSNRDVLECVAVQLAEWKHKPENKQNEIAVEEEGVVFANMIDLIYKIVPVLVPFHQGKLSQLKRHMKANIVNSDGNSSYMTGASGNYDDEDEDEGFNESQEGLDIVQKFIEKITDRIGIECKLPIDRQNSLVKLCSASIHQFADEYVQINKAYKLLPVSKRNIQNLRPMLLNNEKQISQLPVFLLRDNREYEMYSLHNHKTADLVHLKPENDLLPSEGTLYVTNYRVIFHGNSVEYDDKLGLCYKEYI